MAPRRLALRLSLILMLGLFLPVASLAADQLLLQVEGDAEALEENIEAHLDKVEGRDAIGLRRYAQYARERVKAAARALGYYRVEVRSRVLEEELPRLELRVTPGERVLFQEVQVRIRGPANDLKAFQLPADMMPSPGDPLNHGRYTALKREIERRALQYGFFDGRFEKHQLRIDVAEGTADLLLVYQSGERYRLGEVRFPDNLPLSASFLELYVPFEPGTPYDSSHIAQLSQALRSSGYFDEVLVEAPPEKAREKTLPVRVQLTTRRPHDISAGAGFSTDVGPRGRVSWTQHWFNPWGHRRGADLELAYPRQNLSGWYEIPLDPPTTDHVRLTGGLQREDIEDTQSRLMTLATQWQHQLASGWQRVVSLNWQQESFELGNEKGETTLLLPGLSFSRRQVDQPIDPTRGYRLQVDLTGAHEAVISDLSLFKATLTAKGLATIGAGHRFLGRFTVGGITADGFDQVPPTLRFFAGGDQSIRGYDYRSLSPRDDDGEEVGGRYLLEASAEYQYPLRERWRLAFFVDHGNAVDDLDRDLKTGLGTGLRWVSPLGPLRLDFAHAVDNGDFRVHFSMGPEL